MSYLILPFYVSAPNYSTDKTFFPAYLEAPTVRKGMRFRRLPLGAGGSLPRWASGSNHLVILFGTKSMPHDNSGERLKQQLVEKRPDSEVDNPPPPPPPQLPPTTTPPPVTQGIFHQEIRSQVSDIEDRVKRAERWMIGLTAAIAFFGLCSVVVAVLQWQSMDGQLEEMRRGGVDTHALANAAIDQADAAQQFSDTAEDINGEMSDAVDQLSAAANNAKASIQATQDAMRLDQRAWLSVGDDTYAIDESGPVTSSVTVLNTGKSPATNVLCRITGVTKPKGHVLADSDIVYSADLPTQKQGTLFPNQHFPLAAGGPPMEPGSQRRWFASVRSGEQVQYFFGNVRYKDTFGRDHWTHFCSQFVPGTKSGTPCPIYNDTDDSKRK